MARSDVMQERLDAIVQNLQTLGKGKTVNIMFRSSNNTPNVLPLSSNASGVVDAAQLSAVQTFVNGLKTASDTYDTETIPYSTKAAELKVIRESATYQNAKATFDAQNVVENSNELLQAKGRYVTA